MKKVVSLILVVALFASLAICASAAKPVIVVHDQTPEETQKEIEHGWCAQWNQDALKNNKVVNSGALVRMSADQVKVLSITEGTEQTWTTCAQAATVKELRAVCEADERLNNLTVFRQRNVTAEGPIDIEVKLWPCNPVRKTNQAVVILFRAEGTEGWEVVGYNNESNVCSATLAGNGAYVVAMAW